MKSILPPYSPPWMRQKRKSPVPSHTDLLPAASCFRIFDRSGFSRAAAAVPSGHESKRRTGKGIERVSVVAFDSGKNKEAVPIGAGTYLDGKCFVWLRQKLLKSVRIPASFFLARQKIFSRQSAYRHLLVLLLSFRGCGVPSKAAVRLLRGYGEAHISRLGPF